MECKRCGHVLSKTGFTCTNCGMMMSAEQIKKQKEQMDIQKSVEMVSEKYGHKNIIYEKRDDSTLKWKGIFLLLALLLLIILIGLLVYF